MIRPIISMLTVGLAASLMSAAAAQPTTPMQQQHADDHTISGRPAMGSHHSFGDAEKWAKEFDDPQRDALQKPDEVLDARHLRPADKVADIGAGTGYFSVRIAPRLQDGKVFAVDIEPPALGFGASASYAHRSKSQLRQDRDECCLLGDPSSAALLESQRPTWAIFMSSFG